MRGPYTLRIEGEEHAPSSFGPLADHRGQPIYNPDQLYRDAQLAAMRLAAELEAEVVVIGRQGRGGAQAVEAARFRGRREGEFVYVSLPGSFNECRYARPQVQA